jgi:hypothetical protein
MNLTERDFNYRSDEEYYAKGFDAGTKVYGKDDSLQTRLHRQFQVQ